MRLIINLILVASICALGYLLYYGIKEPIAFKEAYSERKGAVVDQLKEIRTAQELYRGVTGEFASDFDSLRHVLRTDSFTIVYIEGDPDDPTSGEFVRREIKKPAIDSVMAMGVELDKLEFVPYSDNNDKFEMQADTLTYQKTLVNVVLCRTRYTTFMGNYADIKYARYDNLYDPTNFVQFGDMNAPNLGGNWE